MRSVEALEMTRMKSVEGKKVMVEVNMVEAVCDLWSVVCGLWLKGFKGSFMSGTEVNRLLYAGSYVVAS